MDFKTSSSEKLIINASVDGDNQTTNDDQSRQWSTSNILNDSDADAEQLTIDIKKHSSDDIVKWYKMGTNRLGDDKEVTLQQEYEEFILHLRHAAGYRAEFDIYQVLAFRAVVGRDANKYLKPFKTLRGLVGEKWSDLEIRWLNSYQRVLCQAIICFIIQTIGITAILTTQFVAYWNEQSDRAQCDYHIQRWKSDAHLKLLAFLWTSFISLGVSGWVYRARHSGFYSVLLFMKSVEIEYPHFLSITWLQFGLLTNYYVITSAVFGSYILIYQTEGGTDTIGMVLQAVALFFVLELDYIVVHPRDFLSIYKFFDLYIIDNKHKTLPIKLDKQSSENIFQKPCAKCHNQSCLQTTLGFVSFFLLILMTFGALVAPFLIMICW